MFENLTMVRVRYAETDRMGYVYYGNYPQYYEVGRVEALREIGFTYRSMEDSGIILPVLSLEIKYIRPAIYDDLLQIKTVIPELPSSRITFEHEIFNENKELLNKARLQLVFVDRETKKPCRAPEHLLKAMRGFYREGEE